MDKESDKRRRELELELKAGRERGSELNSESGAGRREGEGEREPKPPAPSAALLAESEPQQPSLPLHPFALARRDESGKLLPPDPRVVEAMLLSTSQRSSAERMKGAAKWLWLLAGLLLAAEAFALLRLFWI